MNPIRHCVAVCAGLNCANMYCLFLHVSGSLMKTPGEERTQQKGGYVRCVHEWEITAVRS